MYLSSKTEMDPDAVSTKWGSVTLIIDGVPTPGGSAAIPTATPIPCDYQYMVLDDGASVAITGYTGKERNVVIPSMIGPYHVTEIGVAAFAQQLEINSVVIPEGVTRIAYSSFFNCVRLQTIEIPDSTVEIEEGAFVNCVSLENVKLPQALDTVSIRDAAGLPLKTLDWFYQNNEDGSTITITAYRGSETEVVVPSTVDGYQVTAIGEAVFKEMPLTRVTISEGITTIAPEAFRLCQNLSEVTLPSTLTTITACAFQETPSLKTIHLPDGLRSIKNHAFRASGLTAVEIPDSVTEVGEGVFSNCGSLAEAAIGSGVSAITDFFFDECYALERIKIPAGVTRIGRYAFSRTGLKSIEWEERNEQPYTIEANAFQQCSALTSFEPAEGLTILGKEALLECAALETVTLPAGTAWIDHASFAYCGKLSSLTLNEGLDTIGTYAFYCCQSLSRLDCPESVNEIGDSAFEGSGIQDSANVVLPRYLDNTYKRLKMGLPVETFVLSNCGYDQWEIVGYNGEDTELIIPETYHGKRIVQIGSKAFSHNSRLVSVTVPDSVTTIDKYAFEKCSRLSRVVLGKNVQSVGAGAFNNCGELREVRFTGEEYVRFASDVFAKCPNLTEIVLPSGAEYSNIYRFKVGLPLAATHLKGTWHMKLLVSDDKILNADEYRNYIKAIHLFGDGTGKLECRTSDNRDFNIKLYTDYDEATGEVRVLVMGAYTNENKELLDINIKLGVMSEKERTLTGRLENGILLLADSSSSWVIFTGDENGESLFTAFPIQPALVGDWESIPAAENAPVVRFSIQNDGCSAVVMTHYGEGNDEYSTAQVWEMDGVLYFMNSERGETASYELSEDGQRLTMKRWWRLWAEHEFLRTRFEPDLETAMKEWLRQNAPAE